MHWRHSTHGSCECEAKRFHIVQCAVLPASPIGFTFDVSVSLTFMLLSGTSRVCAATCSRFHSLGALLF